MQVLLEMVKDYERRNIAVYFVQLKEDIKRRFVASGILDSQADARCFEATADVCVCVRARVCVRVCLCCVCAE